MNSDDHETGLAVAPVPGLQVGERADAVDARVGPEVHEHGVPAQRFERERPPAGCVEPRLRCLRIRGRRRARAAGRLRRAVSPGVGLAVAAQVSQAGPRRAALLELLRGVHEERRQVVGDRRLEAQVVLAQHQQGHEHHHRSRGELEPRALPGQPAGEPAPADHQGVEHHRGPDPYASATASRPAVNVCAADTVITPARIGPAHGAYTSPRLSPSNESRAEALARAGRAAGAERARACRARASNGHRGPESGAKRPNTSSTTMASVRTRSSGSPEHGLLHRRARRWRR